MIASQKIGKSFIGALNYNLKKMHHPDPKQRAVLLDHNFSKIEVKTIRKELELVRGERPNLNRYVYHTSLNFSKEDKLDNKLLLAIAHDYLRESGYTNNQYLIFRHHDADHPHIHLLVNRITFEGGVISDSNNYKKSEAILRKLEKRYNLISVEPSNKVSQKAATKNELEMVMRTGKPSEKMVLQEILKKLIIKDDMTMPELIRQGEQKGVYFLFSQASTGRVSGVTYFYEGFKIKGQALGNRFKWSELIKNVNYEQTRDGQAISQANSRTKAIYGDFTKPGEQRSAGQRGDRFFRGNTDDSTNEYRQPTATEEFGEETYPDRERSLATNQDADGNHRDTADTMYHDNFDLDFEISDDIDDEAINGRNRRRKAMSRTNTR